MVRKIQQQLPLLEINPGNFDVKDLKPAAQTLKRGGVIAYPTETVYGLGANIFHQKAVQKIYRVKRRDPHQPISVMIASVDSVDEFCTGVHDYARQLMHQWKMHRIKNRHGANSFRKFMAVWLMLRLNADHKESMMFMRRLNDLFA